MSRLVAVPSLRSSLRRRPFVALVLLILLLVGGYAARAVTEHGSARPGVSASAATVSLAELPAEARHTVTLIRQGGPYPYPEDGSVYRNLGGQLPHEPAGYYREYTVPTPGESDRGTRRIIAGRDGTLYYTGDHYRTFRRVTG